jgi:hypothetical protein
MTEAERALERSLLAVIEHEREVGIQIGKLSRENGSEGVVVEPAFGITDWSGADLVKCLTPEEDARLEAQFYDESSHPDFSPQAQPSQLTYWLYAIAGLITGAGAVGVYTLA